MKKKKDSTRVESQPSADHGDLPRPATSTSEGNSPEQKNPMWVHCEKCSNEWIAAWLPMPIGKMSPLMKAPCPMCGGRKVFLGAIPKPTTEGDAIAWLKNGDTGTSSETIWSVLTGHPVARRGTPCDPDDFGRCYRLLQVMPSWRVRLPEVATSYPSWTALIAAWDELTALYEEELPSGRCPKLYNRMKELGV